MEANPYQTPVDAVAPKLPQSSPAFVAAFVITLILGSLLVLLAMHGTRNYFILTAGPFPIKPMPAYILCLPTVTLGSAVVMLYSALKCKQRKAIPAIIAFAASVFLILVVNPVLSSFLL